MEQSLSPLIPVREALDAGDMRPLYIGWLASVAAGERDEDETEPPLPPGMTKLPAPFKALARFLRIDGESLTAPLTEAKRQTISGRAWSRGSRRCRQSGRTNCCSS